MDRSQGRRRDFGLPRRQDQSATGTDLDTLLVRVRRSFANSSQKAAWQAKRGDTQWKKIALLATAISRAREVGDAPDEGLSGMASQLQLLLLGAGWFAQTNVSAKAIMTIMTIMTIVFTTFSLSLLSF